VILFKGRLAMARKLRRKYKVNSDNNTRRWALLIYIAGDNNLSNAGLEDIDEMCEEGSSSDVHVGIEIDTYGEYTGSIRYEITERDYTGHGHRTVIDRLPEKDTGDPRTLTDFLDWGFARYPAKNRLVVVWNHGSGFRSVRRDVGYDDFGSSLDMPEIETAFKKAKITPRNKLQIVGFDACLMNMLEVVHHFKDQAEIIVGSQQTEPGDGWPYNLVVKQAKTSTTPEDLARGIVKVYMDDYKATGISDITQSAIRTSATPAIVEAVSKLGEKLIKNMSTLGDAIRTIRISAQTFQIADYIDLIHFADLLLKNMDNTQVKAAADRVIQATEKSIVARDKNGSSVKNSHGLSIWFPASRWLYLNYRAKYLELKCNESHFGWTNFLDAYHV
jgi:hypothetical protein